MVAGCFLFATGLGAVALGVTVTGLVIVFMHSRKVMSSNAKSFPQPPGALSIIVNIKVVIDAGVVKLARYWVQWGVSNRGRLPVVNSAMSFPISVSRRMERFGNNGKGHL